MEDVNSTDQQEVPQQTTEPIGGQAMTPQQEFDNLVARKEELWARIKSNTLYELSDEWKEIQQIDAHLLVLWNEGNGGVTRKEDK